MFKARGLLGRGRCPARPIGISILFDDDDDDVYYHIRWRLKLEGETENMGVCTKERKDVAAEVLMATPCTKSLGGESGGHKHEGCGGRSACCKFAAVSWAGAGGGRSLRRFFFWKDVFFVSLTFVGK